MRYADHLPVVEGAVAEALALSAAEGQAEFRGVAFHSGTSSPYHADDQTPPFHTVPHFGRFAPLHGPGHLVLVEPGQPTRLVYNVPKDFWHEGHPRPEHPCFDHMQVAEVGSWDDALEEAGQLEGWAYVGNDPAAAEALGIAAEAIEPEVLLASLDWQRGVKTPYEVECLRQAAERAGLGHAAVRQGVAQGLSERELHFEYLRATGHLENETPYPNIIAWDEASAVLHYTSKRPSAPAPGHGFLIDAGAAHAGYASDITRTYVREGAHGTFRQLLAGMLELQDELVAALRPGLSYVDLHGLSWRGVATILCDAGVLTVSVDEAVERKLVWPFYPHGVGHHLGLQVHDVGGQQAGPAGGKTEPPQAFPHLRTTRTLEAGHVVTIEPGLYLIPLLLQEHRDKQDPAFDWDLIDALIPCGGIRIEDDVAVTADGPDNLSRPYVPVDAEL
jgi:Xaa-Pro dipeptidase